MITTYYKYEIYKANDGKYNVARHAFGVCGLERKCETFQQAFSYAYGCAFANIDNMIINDNCMNEYKAYCEA